jgi:glycosyltransferase involved in cell wall biosynthesis
VIQSSSSRRIISFIVKRLFFLINFQACICQQELPFVIVIPSYNNQEWCQKNLNSVFEQKYTNYRVIYIDDHSNDNTEKFVLDYLNVNSKYREKCTLIRNNKRRGALSNLYTAIHSCKDEEIIVAVDGDDFLYDEHVLNKLNTIYLKGDVWLTFGQFIESPQYIVGNEPAVPIPPQIIKNHSFRRWSKVPSHLRTFYAGLFKKIKKKDLLYQCEFFPMAWDLAIMLPMLEMASERHAFVKDILYIYNVINPLSDNRVNKKLQLGLANYIRKKPVYPRLDSL